MRMRRMGRQDEHRDRLDRHERLGENVIDRRAGLLERDRLVMVCVDLQREFARGDELRDEAPPLADVQLLRAERAGDLLPARVAVVVHDRREPVVGVLVHAELAFPSGLQQIVDRLRRLRARHLLGVEEVDEQRGPKPVQVAVLVGEAGAERATVRRIEAHDRARFLERIERGAAHVHRVEVVFARARLGDNAVEQRLRPAGQDIDFQERIFRFESGRELAQVLALVREAKNERNVVWYAPINREDLRQFTTAFEAKYPSLKVDVLTGGPQTLLNRILTETRAGKYNFDTMNVRSSALYTLKKAGAVMRFESPNRRALRAGFADKDGYLNGLWASLLVYLYNAKQVPRAQAPKSIDDLLQHRWKGKLGMDQDADDWLAAVMDYYGDARAREIARALGAQHLNVRKGRSLISQLVAAGEFPLQIDAHHHDAVALKKAGAPIDYVFPEPFVPVMAVSMFVLSSHPPHPHARSEEHTSELQSR